MSENFLKKLELMIQTQLIARGITDNRVLAAIRATPRHFFVQEDLQSSAYEDRPLSIECGATISQPFIVGFMTEAAQIKPTDRVLETGTGSGYQTAILARLASEVYSIEIESVLSSCAQKNLLKLKIKNAYLRVGDAYLGWTEEAPFDVILLTAAPAQIPEVLFSQLAKGGRLVGPVGEQDQVLVRYTESNGQFKREELLAVSFLPMKQLRKDKK